MSDYRAYLDSPEWAERRTYMLERAGHRCALCDRNGSLNVHHRTYVRLGREFDADLIVLCRDCHALFHGHLPDRRDVLLDRLARDNATTDEIRELADICVQRSASRPAPHPPTHLPHQAPANFALPEKRPKGDR